jgi:hypothetical protein
VANQPTGYVELLMLKVIRNVSNHSPLGQRPLHFIRPLEQIPHGTKNKLPLLRAHCQPGGSVPKERRAERQVTGRPLLLHCQGPVFLAIFCPLLAPSQKSKAELVRSKGSIEIGRCQGPLCKRVMVVQSHLCAGRLMQ